jgi:hypothetical protein
MAEDTGVQDNVPPTTQRGAESATGTAIAEAGRTDRPEGEDRGSRVPIEGGQPPADALEIHPNTEKQGEPARFTSNGQLEANTVGSPTGPVPVSTVASTPEEAKKIIEKRDRDHDEYVKQRKGNRKLSDQEIATLGRAELSAIASHRGYEIRQGGTTTTRAEFQRAQEKDEHLVDPAKDDEDYDDFDK